MEKGDSRSEKLGFSSTIYVKRISKIESASSIYNLSSEFCVVTKSITFESIDHAKKTRKPSTCHS